MKIIILAPEQHPPYIEGIQKSARATREALETVGHEILTFSQRSYGEPEQGIIYAFSVQRSRLLKYFSWLYNAPSLAQRILDERPNRILVYSLDWSFLPVLFFLLYKKATTKVTICLFSARELSGPASLFIKTVKAHTDVHFWSFSTYLAELLKKKGIESERITCAPVFFTKPLTRMPSPVSSDTLYRIGYMSSGITDAGIDIMVELAKNLPGVEVTLAIRDFSVDEESSRVSELPHLPNLRIERNLLDVQSFLARMNAIILPPKREEATMAIPLVALEAAYAGCAVFARSLPVLKELEKRGVALLFSDINDLTQMIKREISTPRARLDKALSDFLEVKEFVRRITL